MKPDRPPAGATPPVEAVLAGLWSIPVPIPDNPLGHTNVYAFETPRGPVMVDAGWDDDTSWSALCAGLGRAGYDVSDCYGVLVTHMHPDHHGLSGRVQGASGAWVAMHPKDAALVGRVGHTKAEFVDEIGGLLLDAGASESEIGPGSTRRARRPRPPMLAPDRELVDGEHVDVPGWAVAAVWTPGHSPGHTCFRVLDHGLLLSGDHVLPTITPHIALSRADRGGDPLADFLASLEKVNRPDVIGVLPAHEHRFTPLDRRVQQITTHHRAHLEAIEALLADGPRTLWDLARRLEWNRPWDELDLSMRRAAVNETAAHLRYLARRDRVVRWRGVRPITFERGPAALAVDTPSSVR